MRIKGKKDLISNGIDCSIGYWKKIGIGKFDMQSYKKIEKASEGYILFQKRKGSRNSAIRESPVSSQLAFHIRF